jgi:PTH1 family peptidyl-tRNA hydrolase
VKLIVGLGNPGPRYASTRHNVGTRIVERFAAGCGFTLDEDVFDGRFGRATLNPPRDAPDVASVEVGVLAPQTFMNDSGESVAAALRALPVADLPTDLIVVLDDVDLEFGRLRIRPRGGAGGHRGLADVIDWIETNDFPRLRFGVGRPPEGHDTADWVLRDFAANEESELRHRLPVAVEALRSILWAGVPNSMNRYNGDPDAGA